MSYGIGSEILCLTSGGLDTSGHVETDPRIVAAERIARRWLTERGSCFWARGMGLGLGLLINADLSPGQVRRIEIDARQEALRVDGVTQATVSASLLGGTLTVTGKFRLQTGGWFTLTVTPGEANTITLEDA